MLRRPSPTRQLSVCSPARSGGARHQKAELRTLLDRSGGTSRRTVRCRAPGSAPEVIVQHQLLAGQRSTSPSRSRCRSRKLPIARGRGCDQRKAHPVAVFQGAVDTTFAAFGRFLKTNEAARRAAARHRDGSIRRGENARCNRTPTNIDEFGLAARLSIEPLIVSLARCRHRCE
jgi:hypothetical protein